MERSVGPDRSRRPAEGARRAAGGRAGAHPGRPHGVVTVRLLPRRGRHDDAGPGRHTADGDPPADLRRRPLPELRLLRIAAAVVVVFDLNDFDETAVGPWEWDLKRLATSLVLVGRGNGASEEDLRVTVLTAVRSYRKVLEDFAHKDLLEQWRAAVDDHSPFVHRFGRDDPMFRRGFANALRHDSVAALPKLTEVVAGRRRFTSRPPLLCRVEESVAAAVVDALPALLAHHRRRPPESDLSASEVVDVAQKVVGVGSVGTQDFVILLDATSRRATVDPATQAGRAVRRPDQRWAARGPAHEGARIASGQRTMQAVSDPLLGWTTVHGLPFYVRQLKDLKASMPLAALVGPGPRRLRLAVGLHPRAGARPQRRSRTHCRLLRAGHGAGRGHRPLRALLRGPDREGPCRGRGARCGPGRCRPQPGPDPLPDHAAAGLAGPRRLQSPDARTTETYFTELELRLPIGRVESWTGCGCWDGGVPHSAWRSSGRRWRGSTGSTPSRASHPRARSTAGSPRPSGCSTAWRSVIRPSAWPTPPSSWP